MRILHIVISLKKINYGVWNAAIFASDYLASKQDIESELWICLDEDPMDVELQIPSYFFQSNQLTNKGIHHWLSEYDPNNTIVVTHGAWLKPTKIGYWAQKQGFKWIYTPHGMLEKWALEKGLNRKWIYFRLYEKRMAKKASAIRAVSSVEQETLTTLVKRRIDLINNGVKMPIQQNIEKENSCEYILFMARLHFKKGIFHLVNAWNETLKNNERFRLLIVGPDEGELVKIKPLFCANIEYLGPIYGMEKIELLEKAHYYALPSYSEGFPTSVVEAMSYGAIPIISDGCNFPEVFSHNLGYRVEPGKESIKRVLSTLAGQEYDKKLSHLNRQYILKHLTDEYIGQSLLKLYLQVMNSGN